MCPKVDWFCAHIYCILIFVFKNITGHLYFDGVFDTSTDSVFGRENNDGNLSLIQEDSV